MFYRWQGGIAIHGTNEPWPLSRCPRGTQVHNNR
jgi:hypothetical protein